MRTAPEAVAAALATTTYPLSSDGYTQCLRSLTDWYDKRGTGWANANAGWNGSIARRGPDYSPPAGAPMYFLGGPNGDVGIHVGSGLVRGVDLSGNGGVVTESIAQRIRSSGNRYVGWTADLAGEFIDFTPSDTPEPEKEIDMPGRILKTSETTDHTTQRSNGKVFFDGPAGVKYIANPTHLALLQRYLADDTPAFYASEWAIINTYLSPSATPDANALESAMRAALKGITLGPGTDPGVLSDRVLSDLAARLKA